MAITEKEIKTLARLAKLDFRGDRYREFAGEFDEIINFANTINTSVVGDTSSIKEVGGREIAYKDLRTDEVEASLDNEKITSDVQAENGYFSVRRVVK